jgi:PKD repeat protein
MKGLLAALLVASLAFAGCTGKDNGTTTSRSGAASSGSTTNTASTTTGSVTTSATTTGSGTQTSDTTSGTPQNHAPTASLVANNATGSIPFNVTFTLGGTDADEDAMTYTLAFGDGSADATGSTLPAEVQHTYSLEGNFTVLFTVSDGTASSNQTVVVQALVGTVAAGQSVDFAYTADPAGCADAPSKMVFGTPAAGKTWAEWAVDPATVGHPFTAVFTGANPLLIIGQVAFYDATDSNMDASVTGTSPLAGTVPEGAVHAMFVDCGGGTISGYYQTS